MSDDEDIDNEDIDECTHADGCGCGDNWNQMRREAYANGKAVGKAIVRTEELKPLRAQLEKVREQVSNAHAMNREGRGISCRVHLLEALRMLEAILEGKEP